MTNSRTLLAEYAKSSSEAAFRELVSRYIGLVYGTALRLVNGDTHLAQDVTQMVFIDLARKAQDLPTRVMLGGWLHQRTCNVAAPMMRAQRRRQAREKEAVQMNALQNGSNADLAHVAPILDQAITHLGSEDRKAVILRFFEQRDFRDIGEALGITDDAARKRVARALEKLHAQLIRRGVTLSAAALAAALASETLTAAPAGLAATIAGTALATTATGTGTTLTLLKLMATANLKTAIITAIILASVATPFLLQHQAQARLREQGEALQHQAEQLATLQREKERLSSLVAPSESSQTAPNDQLNEVLKLRGEIGRLQASVQELRTSKTNEPLSREDALASMRQMYLDRVSRLKQLFATNPAQAVPELRNLDDRQWLELVQYELNDPDPDYSRAMSFARSKAQIDFALGMLGDALRQYGKNNGGQFPTDLSQLAPYFKSPVDDAVLKDWAILPTRSLPSEMRVNEDWVITQKAAINADLDQRIVVGLEITKLGQGGSSQWGSVP